MKPLLIRSLMLSCMLSVPVWGYAADTLQPRAEINLRAGTDRSILMTELWVPLAQQSDRVLYGDLRLMGDRDDNYEGNLGIGYRQIVPKLKSVVGANAWIDRRRTQNGNYFNQVTLGIESLGDKIDLRANTYIQLNSAKNMLTPNIGSSKPYLAGSGIFYDTNGVITEEPQHGIDAEIGYRLPVFEKQIDTTRIYAGGYHFWGDKTDNVTGFRLRTEAQINSIFSIGARFQHDGPRGSQGFLEATLRFPFKSKKLYQEHGLRARLDESPERDIDIVTGTREIDSGLMKPVLNAVGTEQRILYVDNTASANGIGTKDNPFSTLAAAHAALQENDILYINHGDGTTNGMSQGIIIDKAGVQLIGSGSALTHSGYTLLDAGLAPIIINTQTYVNDVVSSGVSVTADKVYVSGISVNGATGNGIYAVADGVGKNFSSVVIDNVTVTSNARRGVLVAALNGGTINQASVINSTVLTNTNGGLGRGIEIRLDGVGSYLNQAAVTGNSVSGNSSYGIFVVVQNGAVMNDAYVAGNMTTTNSLGGINVTAQSSGQLNNAIVENNEINVNLQNGLIISSNNNAVFSSAIVRNNIITGSTTNGMYVNAGSYGVLSDVLVQNNVVIGNTIHGIYYIANGNGVINTGILEGNTVSGNTSGGIRAEAATNGQMINTLVRNNIITNNAGHGVFVYGNGNSVINFASVERNYIATSGQHGLNITSGGTSVVHTSVSMNDIIGNGTTSGSTQYYGVYVNNDSTAAYTADLGGDTLGSAGLNRIFNSTFQDVFIDSMPGTGTTTGVLIKAQNNWWGINTGLAVGRRTLDGNSTIDSTAFLTTDPRP